LPQRASTHNRETTWIRGPRNEVIYFVGEPEEWLWRQVEAFGVLLEASRTGPLPYYRRDNLPFGQDWNDEADSLPKRSSGWATSLPGIRIASLIEIPYANAGGEEVNAESARAFGRDLARAIHLYLDECGR
jgi:hypothetical protein